MPDKLRLPNRRESLAVPCKENALKVIPRSVAAVCLLMLACGGCSNNDASAKSIEAAIQRDRDIQREVASEIGIVEKYWSPSSTMKKYIEGLRAIDLSDCPHDFQEAYLRHIQAWERLWIEKANNEGIAAFVKGYFGDGDSILRRMQSDETAQKEVADTWFEVERIALKHGASLATREP